MTYGSSGGLRKDRFRRGVWHSRGPRQARTACYESKKPAANFSDRVSTNPTGTPMSVETTHPRPNQWVITMAPMMSGIQRMVVISSDGRMKIQKKDDDFSRRCASSASRRLKIECLIVSRFTPDVNVRWLPQPLGCFYLVRWSSELAANHDFTACV